ncbi:hypothetical protein TOT_040000758 [Theileria orientalis strain Shintoku]|uniref:Uncharacterized protein n=1 Tax=Theileria orientalis strain Shintoku TaxID=869250 RepID=J7MGY4_THEOR|nr:hypothetical protein TOT_040000758 [Theileria orientalis strain Shintoku]BAM42391.1 hypothetical protein TOT_040000758 [Theileria orientalis strain Shintoku]|eukprot:XP_009692692.1 hypothetical protein TOT_040000758 [Theileria orientalis strain Shintoku]
MHARIIDAGSVYGGVRALNVDSVRLLRAPLDVSGAYSYMDVYKAEYYEKGWFSFALRFEKSRLKFEEAMKSSMSFSASSRTHEVRYKLPMCT